ncbi:hypothetical protein KXV29_004610 [Aspergillus fumigatus]|nr:hypothetical protein KXX50_004346 [Aspergillus fumigatus]KAH1402052.1 hypothetical protein KXX51_002998 [Aspergillus fumigatus]KAH1440566.1 hypothetical protein KXX68_003216 [Aspergillus fumigatus]KAH1471838.1 hypothetical protein KXX53_008751 [Aspergillus fumigatus]KAH1478526.1 hypothetical protein KXX26_001024 [Aspergillus fumigatus]
MSESQPAPLYRHRRLDIIQLYLLDGLTLEDIKSEFERGQSLSEPRLTIDQWKALLRAQGIFKNLSEEEVVFIRGRIGLRGTWDCLVLASDVLLDNIEVEKHYKRRERHQQKTKLPNRRVLTFIPLNFDLDSLSRPDTVKNFQQLLFSTRVHFETSFDSGRWAADDRGLHRWRRETCVMLGQPLRGQSCCESRLVPSDFDTGKVAALERLEFVATRLGDVLAADHFRGLVNNIYSAVESRDMEERAADATVVEIPT